MEAHTGHVLKRKKQNKKNVKSSIITKGKTQFLCQSKGESS